MSLIQYQPPSEEEKIVLEQIELYLKKVELLIHGHGKNSLLVNHALMRLFEAGILCKESIKRDSFTIGD